MSTRKIEALRALAERPGTEGERKAAEFALGVQEAKESASIDVAELADKVMYFGAVGGPGHYMFTRRGQTSQRSVGPWRSLADIDGALTPDDDRTHGADAIHHLDGWTAWAMHDYSQDRRGGSNSVFFAPGTHDREAMRSLAVEAFPTIVARIEAHDDSLVSGGQAR